MARRDARQATIPTAAGAFSSLGRFCNEIILAARIGLGIVFIAHGWQKFATNGLEATAAGFEELGIPLPALAALFSATVEFGGGIALIIGLLVPITGVLLAINMLGAFLFVHVGNGVFVTDGGFELVLALGACGLLLAATGAGRYSLDHLLMQRIARGREHGGEDDGRRQAGAMPARVPGQVPMRDEVADQRTGSRDLGRSRRR